MAFDVQPLIDTEFAKQTAALNAQIVAQAAQIADLQEQLENGTPSEPHPVPSAANTGFRGPLIGFPTGLGTAHDITYENRAASVTAGVTLTGANLTIKNFNMLCSGTLGLNVENATNFTGVDGTVNKPVKGKGTFTRCNFTSLDLTGPSIVTDCYIPGGITGAAFLDPASGNNTVTP